MQFTFGITNPTTTVEIYNRHDCVEYKVLEGYRPSEKDVRSAIGNTLRGTYCHRYSGYYSERAEAVERIKGDIESLERNLEELRFALKVTKKKVWKEV